GAERRARGREDVRQGVLVARRRRVERLARLREVVRRFGEEGAGVFGSGGVPGGRHDGWSQVIEWEGNGRVTPAVAGGAPRRGRRGAGRACGGRRARGRGRGARRGRTSSARPTRRATAASAVRGRRAGPPRRARTRAAPASPRGPTPCAPPRRGRRRRTRAA